MAKKKYQYDALVQPILVEVSVVNNIAVFSASQVSITSLQKFQYQGRFEPLRPLVAAEDITLDKWMSSQGLPYRKRSNYYLITGTVASPIVSTLQEVIQADALFNTQVSPIRRRAPYPMGGTVVPLTQDGETITVDKWLQDHPLPPKAKPRITPGSFAFTETVSSENVKEFAPKDGVVPRKRKVPTPPSFFFVELVNVVEDVTLDKWFQNIVQPKQPKRNNVGSSFTEPPFAREENPTLDKWFNQQDRPPRKGQVTPRPESFEPPFQPAPAGNVTLDSWFQNIVQPVRKPVRPRGSITDPLVPIAPITYVGVFSMGASSITISLKFQYQSRFEPLRAIVVVEDVTVDKWFQPTQTPPADRTRAQYTYPSFFVRNQDGFTYETPMSAAFRPTNSPYPAKKIQPHTHPSVFFNPFVVPAPEVVTVDKWFAGIVSPRGIAPNNFYLYPFNSFTIIPPEVVTLDKWFGGIVSPRGIAGNLFHLYPFHVANVFPIPPFVNRHVILGLNRDTKTGYGVRGQSDIGLNRDTKTGIGVKGDTYLGRNTDSKTGIGISLQQR